MTMFPISKTKENYRAFVDESIDIFKSLLEETSNETIQIIVAQLLDIKENVIEKGEYKGFFEINKRYSLGAIALRFFNDGDALQERLIDVFDGATDYEDYPEK